MTFGSLMTAQLLHALTCRSRRTGLFIGAGLASNRYLSSALAASFGLQALALVVPGLRSLLGLAPLGPLDLGVSVAAGVLPYLVNEARKLGSGDKAGSYTLWGEAIKKPGQIPYLISTPDVPT